MTEEEQRYIEKKGINERTLEGMKERGGRVLSIDGILTFLDAKDADEIERYITKIIDQSFIPRVETKEEMLEVLETDHPFFNMIRDHIKEELSFYNDKARDFIIRALEIYNEKQITVDKERDLGCKAYFMRKDERKTWPQIGKILDIKSPIHTARVYAKTRNLEWPLKA